MYGVPLETLKNHMIELAVAFRCEYRIETDEELEKFNGHVITEDEAKKIVGKLEEEVHKEEEQNVGTKVCCGQWHTSDDDRRLPLTNFYKNKSNKDGHARICKNCFARSQHRQGYNENLRKDKPLPPFDPNTHKWCNRCSSVKARTEFHNSISTKDGVSANCKACNQDKKQKANNKKS